VSQPEPWKPSDALPGELDADGSARLPEVALPDLVELATGDDGSLVDTNGDLDALDVGPEINDTDLKWVDFGDPDVCTPDCDERECGPDGCGGLCGPEEQCDDGNPCTDDSCQDGACENSVLPLEELAVEVDECLCTVDEDCEELEDESLCNGTLVCEDSEEEGVAVCQVDPDTLVDCGDEFFCNGVEICDAETGGCLAGEELELDDGIDCTVDSCDEELDMVVHLPDDEQCDNTLFCDGAEICDAVEGCLPGLAPDPDDGIECTFDSCNDETDEFDHLPNDLACDDTLFCNGVEVCDALLGCVAGVAPELSDGIDCTVDACDEELDSVTHTPSGALCDDENECTIDSCVVPTGCGYENLPTGALCNEELGGWQCNSGECVCEPDCKDRKCGYDGCGGSCGDCPAATQCDLDFGACVHDDWVLVPAGEFLMGSPYSENCHVLDESPRHPVSITVDLLVSAYELTQDDWLSVVPEGTGNPSYFGPEGTLPACTEDDCPLEMVSWWEMLHFANLKSEQEGLEKCYALGGCQGTFGGGCGLNETWCAGDYFCTNFIFKGVDCLGYRLPTEAEWEYFARAGSTSAYPYPPPAGGGKNALCDQCGEEAALEGYAWYCDPGGLTHPAEEALPNGWGLYNISGNVAELCWDAYRHDIYWTLESDDPFSTGHAGSPSRIIRGGSYDSLAEEGRASARGWSDWNRRATNLGARLVRALPPAVCVPECIDRECGGDGCGGSCGVCALGTCDQGTGQCVTDGWVVIPGGTFVMGSPADENCREETEGPQHNVAITRSLLVSDHEVTQSEWTALAKGANPNYYSSAAADPKCAAGDCPVEMVNWFDALAYCNELSEADGLELCYELDDCSGTWGGGCPDGMSCNGDYSCGSVTFAGLGCNGYRLPTEAEWEYLARSGSSKAFPYPSPGSVMGDDCLADAEESELDNYAWYLGNSDVVTYPVRQKEPNDFGLYDMAGNVSEWVFDATPDTVYYPASLDVDPLGPGGASGSSGYRAIRGGSTNLGPDRCRSAWHQSVVEDLREAHIGFRVVRSLPVLSCEADCENRQCGSDGCGGSCGICDDGEECDEDFGACLGDGWVVAPAGSFVMGAWDDEACAAELETPRHTINISRPLLVSDHTVTKGEWESVTGLQTPAFQYLANNCLADDCPVERVNWYEAVVYCNALSELHGLEACYSTAGCGGVIGGGCDEAGGCNADMEETMYKCDQVTFKGVECAGFRLPTEAEWEYFARAGTQAPLPYPAPFGGGKSAEDCAVEIPHPASERNLGDFAWYTYNSSDISHPVGTKGANNWGIYDLFGNVIQWTTDHYHPDESKYGLETATDPTQTNGDFRQVRGCPFNGVTLGHCRSAARLYLEPAHRLQEAGFRVVRTLLCRDGDVRPCGLVEGACLPGIETCDSGIWGACEGAIMPDAALCDGKECGSDDGCGGNCGECAAGFSCDEERFLCVPDHFVIVEADDFVMGSPDSETCRALDEVERDVTITRDMLVSDHEVTRAEWELATGQVTPSYWGPRAPAPQQQCLGDDCPVELVSWFDTLAYCNWRSDLEGLERCYELVDCTGEYGSGCDYEALPNPEEVCVGDYECQDVIFAGLDCTGYRLPTEAEWEFFARAGTTTAYPFPPPDGSEVSVTPDMCQNTCHEEPAIGPYAWYCFNATGGYNRPVRKKLPDGAGLYDTIGNLQELVYDRFLSDTSALGDEDPYSDYLISAQPAGRGGNVGGVLGTMRTADRGGFFSYKHRHRWWGFRVVRTLPGQ